MCGVGRGRDDTEGLGWLAKVQEDGAAWGVEWAYHGEMVVGVV